MRKLVPMLAALAAPAFAAPQSVGIFAQWGAFRDGGRCWAVAEPEGPQRRTKAGAFASLSWVPGRSVRGQLDIRFAGPKRPGSAVLLRIDERTFQLVGGRADGWAPDARADAEILAAMRTGVEMSVETRAESGALMRDFYRLRGAATAIDAAAIACARG